MCVCVCVTAAELPKQNIFQQHAKKKMSLVHSQASNKQLHYLGMFLDLQENSQKGGGGHKIYEIYKIYEIKYHE